MEATVAVKWAEPRQLCIWKEGCARFIRRKGAGNFYRRVAEGRLRKEATVTGRATFISVLHNSGAERDQTEKRKSKKHL